ncbi:Solute carrier 26 [Dinochytrium kinnereticum]|nr:Solute carrier 26 [Dinochytrium kinnereticum]
MPSSTESSPLLGPGEAHTQAEQLHQNLQHPHDRILTASTGDSLQRHHLRLQLGSPVDVDDRQPVDDIWGDDMQGGDAEQDALWPEPGPGHKLRKLFWTRLRYYIPVIGWLPQYNIVENLQSDIIAGITVACLLIPQGLSYAQALVKIPPVYGLYTCLVPLIIYSLLGTSRQLAVGPEALVSILVGAAIKEKSGLKIGPPSGGEGEGSEDAVHMTDNVAENIAIANLMCLMVGLFTSILGFFRLGFLDSVLSRALLRGFVTAVAFVVMIDLSGSLLGLPPLPSEQEAHLSPIERALITLRSLGSAHVPTTVISLISISFLAGAKVFKAKLKEYKVLQLLPEILILVVTSTLLCGVFRWDNYNVEILKDVKGGLIAPALPSISIAKVRYYLISAILISVIGFVESIVVAKTYATKHNYAVSPNRELVALGVANTFGSFFGAWPAFGSLGRSAVNDSTGAKTQVAGFVTGIIIFIAIVALLPLFYFLPKAVCSSIIVVAAVKLIEMHDVYFILRLRAWKDLGLLLMTFLSTLLISIEVGTLISIGTSLLLVIKHTTKTRIAVLGRAFVVDPKSGQVKTKFRSITEAGKVEPIEGALVIRIEEGLFFGNTGQLKDRLKRVEMYGELGVHPGEMPRQRTPASSTTVANSSFPSSRNDSMAFSATPDFVMQDSGVRGVEEEGRKPPSPESSLTSHINGVIFDIGAMNGIDATATQTLIEIVESYHQRNIAVCFVKLRDSCKPLFLRSGLWGLVGMDHFFDKIRDALNYLRENDRIQTSSPHPSSDHISPTFYDPSQGASLSGGSGSFAGIPAAFTVGSWDPKAILFAPGPGLADFSQTESANSSDADNVGIGGPGTAHGTFRKVGPAARLGNGAATGRRPLYPRVVASGNSVASTGTLSGPSRRRGGEDIVDIFSDSEYEDNARIEGDDEETVGSDVWNRR